MSVLYFSAPIPTIKDIMECNPEVKVYFTYKELGWNIREDLIKNITDDPTNKNNVCVESISFWKQTKEPSHQHLTYFPKDTLFEIKVITT